MIEKTTGTVLRVAPFSKTSHIVTWLTPTHGRVATLVKGAQRAKSAFLGQYDLFYTCELLFYSRDTGGLHIIRECSPTNPRTALRGDWRASVCASYSCDLALTMIPSHAPNRQYFDLLEATLDFLCTGRPTKAFVFWFELRSLETTGFSPRVSSCVSCGVGVEAMEGKPLFSYARGGVICRPCAATSGERFANIEADALATMRGWQQSLSPVTAMSSPSAPRQLMVIGKVLERFLAYHVQHLPAGRAIALELLP